MNIGKINDYSLTGVSLESCWFQFFLIVSITFYVVLPNCIELIKSAIVEI